MRNLNKLVGWLGANLLAFCGVPAALDVIQKGTAEGYSPYFISMWGLGELFMAFYVYRKHGLDWPLLYNYGFNLFFIGIIVCYLI